MLNSRLVKTILLFLACACAASAAGVPRAQCFPFETLRPQFRALAEQMLLEALDREALYTLVGGLKPMSSAILTEERRFSLDTAKPQIDEYEGFQTIAEAWRCGDEIWAGVAPIKYVVPAARDEKVGTDELGRPQGQRTVYGNVVNVPAMRRVIAAHTKLYGYHGITPRNYPGEVLTRLETLEMIDRDFGHGYLYGYPAHAVEFYSRLLTRAHNGQPLKPGEAINVDIPTYAPQIMGGRNMGSQFRYRIAPDHEENEEDRHLRTRAAQILAEYRIRREKYIGEGKPGVLALVRDWYDDGKGLCAPSNAKVADAQKPTR